MKDRFIFVSDIVEENGKTIRENNLTKSHAIEIGALVEAFSEECDYEWNGIRLYVVSHQRDCDGSPLYGLGEKGGESLLGGFCDNSLTVIKPATDGKDGEG